MAKYDVTATVTISTTIEPQGQIEEPYGFDGIEDFETEGFRSYGNDIEDECSISFVYTTDTDEDEVQGEIEEGLNSHLDYTGDDIEWEVTNVTIDSCERQQMSIEDAVAAVREFLDTREDAFKAHHPVVCEALEVLLQQF